MSGFVRRCGDVDRCARMSECKAGLQRTIQVAPRLWRLFRVATIPVDAVSTPFVNLPVQLRPTGNPTRDTAVGTWRRRIGGSVGHM
jgi:hypothetical protein